MKNICLIILLTFLVITGCMRKKNLPSELAQQFPETISLKVINPLNLQRVDELVITSISELREEDPAFNANAFVVWADNKEIPSQAIDVTRDGVFDSIIFNIDLNQKEEKAINIHYNAQGENRRSYTKRTQAEISYRAGADFVDGKYTGAKFENTSYIKLPANYTDHQEYIRYEGPGWESDKVGYRFYIDWRNAIDIFGKKTTDMVLQNVGKDGYDSYHNPADWGMDILKVGESLGVGSIAIWKDSKANRVAKTDSVDCRISDGLLYSQIRTRYLGWDTGENKTDLISDLSITAGTRMTKNHMQISAEVSNICTGLAKHQSAEYIESDTNQDGWAYIALYGQQSFVDDNLGTAILFNANQLIEINEDELNHVVVLKPIENQLAYYFLAAWEQEPDGIKTKQAFVDYLEKTIQILNNPLQIN